MKIKKTSLGLQEIFLITIILLAIYFFFSFKGTYSMGILFFIIYFLPSFLARKKKHESGIVILNTFLGWTFLAWVIALIWSVSDEKMPETRNHKE